MVPGVPAALTSSTPNDALGGYPEETAAVRLGVASRVLQPPLFGGLSGARPQSGSPPRPAIEIFQGLGGSAHIRNRTSSGSPGQSGSPPRPPFVVFPSAAGANVRNRTSSGSPPPFHGALWHGGPRGREERPRFERDSLRNRSLEGRPGSRKHRRWTRSVEITGSLRKVLAKCGENPNISDVDALDLQNEVEWRPSAFYRLMENEGATGALDALEAAEDAVSKPRQPRQKDAGQLAEEYERHVRRTFSDTWQFLQGNNSARDLLAKLEKEATRAFGSAAQESGESDTQVALLWMLYWDGEELQTKFGAPPANEITVGGLTPTFRKITHQLARSMGLHSESRDIDGPHGSENKVIALRPPRQRSGGGKDQGGWIIPTFSVGEVLAKA